MTVSKSMDPPQYIKTHCPWLKKNPFNIKEQKKLGQTYNSRLETVTKEKDLKQQKESIPLQSFIKTSPKIWSAAWLTSTGFPNSFPGPTTAAYKHIKFLYGISN